MKEFEDLINEIGGEGFYQKRLLYIVLAPLFFFLPLSWLNEIFLLHTPSHWCNHPYLETLNSSQLKDWKSCFIPIENLADGSVGPSSCRIAIPAIYADENDFWNDTSLSRYFENENHVCPVNETRVTTSKCRRGWSFDRSEFSSTVVTDQNWVCENSYYVPQLFTYGIVGSIIGTIIFSYLSDVLGRCRIFWITTTVVIFFMAIKTFLADIYPAYLVCKLVAASAYVATYQLPFTIITEITDADYRSWAISITNVTWTVGLCFLPLIGWLARDWQIISLVTVLLLAVVYLGWNFVPESPRWQLTVGQRDKAAKTIYDIARTNKKNKPKDLERRLDEMIALIKEENSTKLGYISLFSRQGIAIKTFNLTIALVASNFIYYQLMLNVGNMSGSTFLNFFLLSFIEGPGYFIGTWLSDNYGRRWSHTVLLLINTTFLFVCCGIAIFPSYSLGVIICCLVAKFISSATYLIVYVQTVELFPTCIRNIGMGFTSLLGMVIGISGPYVVYLGTVDARYPYAIMAMITLCGAMSASFLPETIGEGLPETIEAASNFGRQQKYFSLILPKKSHNDDLKIPQEIE